jgi:hypothetical protein
VWWRRAQLGRASRGLFVITFEKKKKNDGCLSATDKPLSADMDHGTWFIIVGLL